MLNVYETFSSIQGESSFAGRPCFFIRLAGCNLRCAYCDTKKAWTEESGRPETVENLLKRADASGLELVELTGGEPLLQPETPVLARRLIETGKTVLVETNGSMDWTVLPPEAHVIIDWKTPCSGMSPEMLESNFTRLRPHDEVKFVIADETDYKAAADVIRRFRLEEQVNHILFSPAWGSDMKSLCGWIVRDGIRNARLNLQLHKFIWGPDAEGV